MRTQEVAVVLAAVFCIARGARILGLFPFPGKSHMIVNSALVKELARRGHQVTVLSFFPESQPVTNLTDISFGSMKYDDHNLPANMFEFEEMSPFKLAHILWKMGISMTETALSLPAAKQLIHLENHKFDLVIMEAFFNEAFLGFAYKFNAPIVQICGFGGTHWMGDWMGNPNIYSYVPDAFLWFGDRMTFWQRLVNTVVGMYWRLGREYYYLPQQDAIMRKHFGSLGPLPSLSDLERNTSLLLLNTHFTVSHPKPLMPSIVQVGGLHVKPPNKLPQDLQKFLDDAPEGVIYFSMGSNLKSSEMPEATTQVFLQVFSRLKRKVLWKWEADKQPNLPNNVKMEKWLPQSDILAHPNIHLFISHGGGLSTQEAVDRGVPIIGIPIFSDQRLNVLKLTTIGFGVLLDYKNITEESLSAAIAEVLQPRYRENARRVSRTYRDQPLTPLQTAVFWTEYVVRHRGAPHMRSAAVDLAWYQYFLLDVIAFLTVVATIPVCLVWHVVFRRRAGHKSKQKTH